MLKKQLIFTITFLVILLITIFSGRHSSSEVVAQQPAENKSKLVLVTSADYPPYEFRETATGNEIIGFDIDIAKYITKELGYQLEIKDTDFSGLIPALQSRRADFVMAGMTPTEERKKNVDFSDIYYEAKNTIVAKKGSNLIKPEDLTGKRVGVQLGTIQEKEAKKFKGITLVALNKTGELILEIKSNRIDAAILEDTIAKGFVASNPDLEFNTITNTQAAGSAIAFPKGSPLVADFNRVLQQIKTSGELEKLVNKWFGNNGKTETSSTSTLSFAKIAPSIPYILEGILVTLRFTAISAFF